MALKLPNNATAAFRVETESVFGDRFAINLYGAGGRGWFVATYRSEGNGRDSGAQPLPNGDWPRFLEIIDGCGFWSLAEADPVAFDPMLVQDGQWLTVTGRDRDRQHRVFRLMTTEPGLEQALTFGRRASGLFVPG